MSNASPTEVDEPGHDPAGAHDEARERSKLHQLARNFFVCLVILFAVLATQAYAIKPVKVPSGSMRVTIECGDRLIVDRLSPKLSSYERCDIVVFQPPRTPSVSVLDVEQVERMADEETASGNDLFHPWRATYIKRLIGKPGDTVEVVDGRAVVDGKELDEPYVTLGSSRAKLDWGPAVVPDGTYFVLGDNRAHSADSRYMGFIPSELMVGIARVRYWPLNRIGTLKADTQDPALDAQVTGANGC